jgi:hypothetical protein
VCVIPEPASRRPVQQRLRARESASVFSVILTADGRLDRTDRPLPTREVPASV